MRSFPILAPLLLVLAGCSPQAPPAARVARQEAAARAPELQHVSDSEEWFPFEQFVASLLLDERFDTLDSLAATCGAGAPRFRDGSSRELHFYLALAGDNFPLSRGQRARFVGALKSWRAARPASHVAAAGYACAMVTLAWDERGAAVATRTSTRQFERFDEDLALAWEALEPDQHARGRVGGWYLAALRVGLGMGWDRGRMMQARNDCLRDAPWIESAEGMVARALLPRWGGEPGEWERFALAVAKSSPDGRGLQRYAWIVWLLDEVHDNIFRETAASWPTADAGYQALEREHPDSVTLPSRHARFAWLAGDREVAKALFAKLGDRMDPSVWHGDEEFLAARQWANAGPS
jgi:hypothetical protein